MAATTIRGASLFGWPAAGIKAGQAIGTTDEIGLRAVDKPYHVHDFTRRSCICWVSITCGLRFFTMAAASAPPLTAAI